MSVVEFSKMVASGNDFIVINNLGKTPALAGGFPGFAKAACPRRFAIGADGLLVLEPSRKADLKMRIFNADGSEAEMCGNGVRCAALYAAKNVVHQKSLSIDTIAGLQRTDVLGDVVKVRMPDPMGFVADISLIIGQKKYNAFSLNTGVPHAVIFVEDLDTVDILDVGPKIRYHKKFGPKGTNVNFVSVTRKDGIRVRTYERGVEDETLACGTGSTASALIASLVYKIRSPVNVRTKGGNSLTIYFNIDNKNIITEVHLQGDAQIVYEGRFEYV